MSRPCPYCGGTENKIKLTEEKFEIVECSACSFVFLLNPPADDEIYEKYYQIEFKPEDYKSDSAFPHLSDIYTINQRRVEFIKKLCPSGRLLDIGCGSGLFMKSVSGAWYDCYGIDVSQTALNFARNGFGLKVDSKTTDDLINENAKFDIVTLFHVLEHFLNPVEELVKVRELLNPKGMCIIEVPNFNSIKFKLSGSKWKGGNHPLYHRSFFTSSSLEKVLIKAGFNSSLRLRVSYKLSGKSFAYNLSKDLFNLFAADAFLNFVAYK